MTEKLQLIKDIEYLNDYQALANILLGWANKKQNDELDAAIKYMTRVAFYVNAMQQDRKAFDTALSQYRADKHRAIERAQKAESQLDDLIKENEKLKKIQNL
mgnify:CR=1 FL=1